MPARVERDAPEDRKGVVGEVRGFAAARRLQAQLSRRLVHVDDLGRQLHPALEVQPVEDLVRGVADAAPGVRRIDLRELRIGVRREVGDVDHREALASAPSRPRSDSTRCRRRGSRAPRCRSRISSASRSYRGSEKRRAASSEREGDVRVRVGGGIPIEHAALPLPREERVAADAKVALRPVPRRSRRSPRSLGPHRAQHRVALALGGRDAILVEADDTTGVAGSGTCSCSRARRERRGARPGLTPAPVAAALRKPRAGTRPRRG